MENTALTGKKETSLTTLQKAAIKVLLEEHFVKTPDDEAEKMIIFDEIKKELPDFTIMQFNKLYREVQHNYYGSLKRIPTEALINKINEQTFSLTGKILDQSSKDIVDQARVINELNKTIASVNRLSDVAPKIEINFKTNLPDDFLVNPAVVIQTKPLEEGEKDGQEN